MACTAPYASECCVPQKPKLLAYPRSISRPHPCTPRALECRNFLTGKVKPALDDFKAAGLDVVAISTDRLDRAEVCAAGSCCASLAGW